MWAEKNPDADGRFKRARADVTATAEEMDIPLENLLTPEYLRRVAWTPPDPVSAESIGEALEALGARRWQIDAIAQVIAEAFVRIDQTPEDPDDDPS